MERGLTAALAALEAVGWGLRPEVLDRFQESRTPHHCAPSKPLSVEHWIIYRNMHGMIIHSASKDLNACEMESWQKLICAIRQSSRSSLRPLTRKQKVSRLCRPSGPSPPPVDGVRAALCKLGVA